MGLCKPYCLTAMKQVLQTLLLYFGKVIKEGCGLSEQATLTTDASVLARNVTALPSSHIFVKAPYLEHNLVFEEGVGVP
jgi:hypothetical protein